MELLIWLIIMLVINSLFGDKNKKNSKRIPGNPDIPGRPGSVELPEMPEESPRSHRVDDYDLPEYIEPEYIEPQYAEQEYIEPEYQEPKRQRPQVKVYGSLGDMLMDMQKVFGEAEAAEQGRQQERARRRARRQRRAEVEMPTPVVAAQPEVKPAAAVSQLTVTPVAKPVMLAATEDKDIPVADLAAVRQNLQLSEVQAGLLWQEILDKPVALRRGARR